MSMRKNAMITAMVPSTLGRNVKIPTTSNSTSKVTPAYRLIAEPTWPDGKLDVTWR